MRAEYRWGNHTLTAETPWWILAPTRTRRVLSKVPDRFESSIREMSKGEVMDERLVRAADLWAWLDRVQGDNWSDPQRAFGHIYNRQLLRRVMRQAFRSKSAGPIRIWSLDCQYAYAGMALQLEALCFQRGDTTAMVAAMHPDRVTPGNDPLLMRDLPEVQ
jgi:hypothetical protein